MTFGMQIAATLVLAPLFVITFSAFAALIKLFSAGDMPGPETSHWRVFMVIMLPFVMAALLVLTWI